MKRDLTIDYETRSELDVTEVGAYEYALHPSTEVLVVGYQIDDGPIKVWFPFRGDPMPADLEEAFLDEDTMRVAHNAFFEQCVSAFVVAKKYTKKAAVRVALAFDAKRWKCTAAKSRAHAGPGKLEQAMIAWRLSVHKDMAGRRLSIKLAKVRPAWKKDPLFNEKWFEDDDEILRLADYCKIDVKAERVLDKALPDLSPYEREVWLLDQRINLRGMSVDVTACRNVLRMVAVEMRELVKELNEITAGAVDNVTKRAAMLDFLQGEEGLDIPNLTKETVEEYLRREDLSPRARRVLEIRQASAMSSIGKYEAFITRTGSDERVRDLLVYHGPSTGRWAGAGVQPQNFPRGIFGSNPDLDPVEEQEAAVEAIHAGCRDTLKLGWGDLLAALSSSLRAMLKASPGKLLYGADYAAIEARILWWLAGHNAGLRLFRDGIDPYVDLAAMIFGKAKDLITKRERFVGKEGVLGSGYGMGWKKFLETCHKKGLTWVTEELAKKAIETYRRLHHPVPKLWSLLERAAIFAVLNPTKRANVLGKVVWFMSDCRRFLYCQLPSGRLLTYPFPEIRFEIKFGERRPALYYWGLNPRTKQWMRESTWGGKLTENVVQAIARDIMVHGMFNVERAGYDLLLTVHDELLSEKERGGSVEEFEKLITDLPPWAAGAPIKAEGWFGDRYRK